MELKLTNCDLSVEIDAEDLNWILSHTDRWNAMFNKYNKLIGVSGYSRIFGGNYNDV